MIFAKLAEFVSSNRILVSRIFALVFFVVLILSGSAHDGTIIEGLLFLVGLVLVGIATVGRLWCSVYISGHKDSQLITLGPYSVTRNPLYFFSLLGFAGIGFATETLTLPFALTLLFSLGYPCVINREEKFLAAKFGSAFTDYCNTTPRFFPSPKLFREPESYTVNPKLFRRTMGDVLWFVWLVGVVELVETLHDSQILSPVIWLL